MAINLDYNSVLFCQSDYQRYIEFEVLHIYSNEEWTFLTNHCLKFLYTVILPNVFGHSCQQ